MQTTPQRYVTAGLVTGGRTGHRFKDQLTAKIAAKLWGLTYVHNPFPKDLHNEHLWEPFLGFGDNEAILNQLDWSGLEVVKFGKTAWTGSSLSEIEPQIKENKLPKVLFLFTESARILLEQVSKNLRDEIVDELREKYWARRASSPISTYFDPSVLNVALHIRRGEDIDENSTAHWRSTPDDFYIKIIEQLQKLPHRVHFHIYSEGKPELFKKFKLLSNVYIHLCPWPPNYQELFTSFHHMITADILVNATSEFSYFTSHMNPNITITHPVELPGHGGAVCGLPEEYRHIIAQSDGTFDMNNLSQALATLPKSFKTKEARVPLVISTDLGESIDILNNVKKWAEINQLDACFLDKELQISIYNMRDMCNINFPFFLYLRNPHLRIKNATAVAKLAAESSFGKIFTKDNEIVSLRYNAGYTFTLGESIEIIEPEVEPLPVVVTTHNRQPLLEQSIKSLLYSFQSSRQKLYIMASAPDQKTLDYLATLSGNPSITEIAISDANLGYACANCASKIFNLKEFVLFEDDFILPEHTKYKIPFWTQQFKLRLQEADLVCFRISIENIPADTIKQFINISDKFLNAKGLWSYYSTQPEDCPPLSGNGLYINSSKYSSTISPPYYFTPDRSCYVNSKTACFANVYVYDAGVNFHVNKDRTGFFEGLSRIPKPPQIVSVNTLKNKTSKQIDLAQKWEQSN